MLGASASFTCPEFACQLHGFILQHCIFSSWPKISGLIRIHKVISLHQEPCWDINKAVPGWTNGLHYVWIIHRLGYKARLGSTHYPARHTHNFPALLLSLYCLGFFKWHNNTNHTDLIDPVYSNNPEAQQPPLTFCLGTFPGESPRWITFLLCLPLLGISIMPTRQAVMLWPCCAEQHRVCSCVQPCQAKHQQCLHFFHLLSVGSLTLVHY